MPMTAFARTLIRIRDTRAISQSKLAERAEFDHGYVSRLESGNRHPSYDAVVAICDALDATEAERYELMTSAGYHHGVTLDGDLLRLQEALRDERLSEDYRAALHDGVAAMLRGCEAVRGRPRLAVVEEVAA